MGNATKGILLVEDEAIIAMEGKNQLEKIGYSVSIVASGEGAVQKALKADTAFDAILMDIDLGSGIDDTQAAVGVAEIDSVTGHFLNVNQRFCSIVDYTHEEMLHKDFQTLMHFDDLVTDPLQMEQLKTGAIREFSTEMHYHRKDGALVWVALTASALNPQGGAPTRYIAVVQDISERKRAEEKLLVSEARYRSIAENTADVIWVLDPLAGKFTYVSPSVERLRGYTPGGSGTISFINEVDQPCTDGSIVHTEVTTNYLFNEQGNVEIVGVSRNITERKLAVEQRQACLPRPVY